jgi:mannonate dehydratase
MMERREFFAGMAAMPVLAAQDYAQRTKGLPPLTIRDIQVITTSGGRRYQWVFVKVITSEPGLYGIGSASNLGQAMSVATAIDKYYKPFWIGKDPDRIEDLWQSTYVHCYWRDSTILNCALSGLDMALWDIKGKRAGMPVYDLLGGKAREAVPLYAHADGRDMQQVEDNVRRFMEEGYSHVRAQMGGYGGGGFIPPGQGSRPATGYSGPAFDEDLYIDTITQLFDHLRSKLGPRVKLLHDVHEHVSPLGAVEFARRMEPYHMFFMEDILPPRYIDHYRRIREICSTPMAIGELFINPLQWVPLIAERLIDFIRCRVSEVGGITREKKIATLCETFGARTAFQEGGDNDPVNQLAAYHVDMSISSFGIQEENHFPEIVHEMLPGTAQLKGGYLYGNGAPGLGIDINETMAAKYPIEPRSLAQVDNWTNVRAIDGSVVMP